MANEPSEPNRAKTEPKANRRQKTKKGPNSWRCQRKQTNYKENDMLQINSKIIQYINNTNKVEQKNKYICDLGESIHLNRRALFFLSICLVFFPFFFLSFICHCFGFGVWSKTSSSEAEAHHLNIGPFCSDVYRIIENINI